MLPLPADRACELKAIHGLITASVLVVTLDEFVAWFPPPAAGAYKIGAAVHLIAARLDIMPLDTVKLQAVTSWALEVSAIAHLVATHLLVGSLNHREVMLPLPTNWASEAVAIQNTTAAHIPAAALDLSVALPLTKTTWARIA